MKTILAIDDDVLVAAMAIAQTGDRDLGQVISDLARRALPSHSLDHFAILPDREMVSATRSPRRSFGGIVVREKGVAGHQVGASKA